MNHRQKTFPAMPMTAMLGEWNVKLKKDSDPVFTALQAADITQAFIVVGFTVI
jgi:hypothetical protein